MTDAFAVAARNRHGRAEVEAGAARVLFVDSADPLRSGRRFAVDPGGESIVTAAAP